MHSSKRGGYLLQVKICVLVRRNAFLQDLKLSLFNFKSKILSNNFVQVWSLKVSKLVLPSGVHQLRKRLTIYWTCFQFKNSWESIIEMSNCYHGVAKCSQRKFWSKFFTQISAEHFCAYFRLHWPALTLIWVLLQNLSIDDANFGQRWWCQ